MPKKPSARVPLLVAALGAAAALALVVTRARRPPPEVAAPPVPTIEAPREPITGPPPAAGPAELALIAPIQVGTASGRWRVKEIHGVRGGTFRVVFAETEGHGRVELDVALVDEEGPAAPATAGRYAVYYVLRRATPEDGDRLARLLARAIERNPDAPVPPGLGTFQPTAREPEML